MWIRTAGVIAALLLLGATEAVAQIDYYVPASPTGTAADLLADFAAAGASAGAGDRIIIRAGAWTDVSVIDPVAVVDHHAPQCFDPTPGAADPARLQALCVTASGAPGSPIVVMGEGFSGEVRDGDVPVTRLLERTSLLIQGSDVEIRDLSFEDSSFYTLEIDEAHDILIENVLFKDRGRFGEGNGVYGSSLIKANYDVHAVEIRKNLFDGFLSTAFGMEASPPAGQPTSGIFIHNNTFRNGRSEGAIATGDGPPHNGAVGSEVTNVQIKNNLFEDHIGDDPNANGNELIVVKTSKNTVRGNTFVNCNGHISNRVGHDNVYDSNVVVGLPLAFRITASGNQVINNVIVDTRKGVLLMHGEGDTWSGTFAEGGNHGYYETKDTLVAHNTFVSNPGTLADWFFATYDVILAGTQNLPQIPDRAGVPPDDTTVVNNVLIGTSTKMILDLGTNPNVVRNLFHATDVAALPDGSHILGIKGDSPIFEDPQFEPMNETGSFPAASAAIDTGAPLTWNPIWYAAWESANDVVRGAGCGIDLGHLEIDQSSCGNVAPAVTVFANGVSDRQVGILSGDSVHFDAVATDDDGLGYPIWYAALGLGSAVSYVWDFDRDPPPGFLTHLVQQPVVSYTLPPGVTEDTFTPSVEVYDRKGATPSPAVQHAYPIVVRESGPAVTLHVDGAAPSASPVLVTSGTTLTLSVEDPPASELGYPIFWASGNLADISYVWNFDGATAPGPLSAFIRVVPVTFDGPVGTTFDIVANVYDNLGIRGSAPLQVEIIDAP